MPHHDWEDACLQMMQRLAPSVADVLKQTTRSSVCTPSQCFESDADAFALHAPGNDAPWTVVAAACTIGVVVVCALGARAVRVTPASSTKDS